MIILKLEMNMYDGKHINFSINDFILELYKIWMLFVRLFLSVQYNYQVQYHTGYLTVSVLVPQCQTTVAFKYSIKHVKYS